MATLKEYRSNFSVGQWFIYQQCIQNGMNSQVSAKYLDAIKNQFTREYEKFWDTASVTRDSYGLPIPLQSWENVEADWDLVFASVSQKTLQSRLFKFFGWDIAILNYMLDLNLPPLKDRVSRDKAGIAILTAALIGKYKYE
jgi:hypothetical protein